MAVPARVLSTDASLNQGLAIAGLRVTMSVEGHVRDALDRGQLVSVLEAFCAPFPEYYLYYPQRRQAAGASEFPSSERARGVRPMPSPLA